MQRAIGGTKVTGSEIWPSWVLPVCSQQETLTQLEFGDTQHERENFDSAYLFSVNRCRHQDQDPQQPKSVAGGGGGSTLVPVFVLPFALRYDKIDPSQRRLVNCEFPACGRAQTAPGILGCGGSPALQGDPRGHDTEEKQQCWRSLPCTSLALNVSVQLCADFFLRKSCGSRNNDSRSLPPLSRLKYGNCIIRVQGPLFSHGWALTGTVSAPPPQKKKMT